MKFSITFSDLTPDEFSRVMAVASGASGVSGSPAQNFAPPPQMQAQPQPNYQPPPQAQSQQAYQPPPPQAQPQQQQAQPQQQQAYQPPPPGQGQAPITMQDVVPAMTQYNAQYKADGLRAVFAKYGAPQNLSQMNEQQLRLVKQHFESMQPAHAFTAQ